MKRAATHLCKRQSENRPFISKLSNFYFDFRPPGKTEERKPDPRGNQNVRIPGGRPEGWSGSELTDTLALRQV